MNKPFEIIANVTMDNLDLDRQAGIIFNYRDFGNYYAFVFNKESVSFLRFVDNNCVGSISQELNGEMPKKANVIKFGNLLARMMNYSSL